MIKKEIRKLLFDAEKRFEQEGKLIELNSGLTIFVGDTHGDLEATESITDKYLNPENKIVFLGDYVDRGQDSEENLNTLLRLKLEHPDNLFLLGGNHEGPLAVKFSPADFWESLDQELYNLYARALSNLPLVVSTSNGIIALHGALPDVKKLEDINEIEFGSRAWQQITWGDWRESKGGYLGDDFATGRPQFGQDWFEEIMARLQKNVLIRSHQPRTRQTIFERRCLTIFTSSAYAVASGRTIAITDLNKEIRTVDDLVIETI